jgi:hypothetical protein
LAAVIERAMARDPAWRFGSADEMRAALAGRVGPPVRPATRVMAVPLPDPATMLVAPVVRGRSSRWYLALAAAVLAVLVVAIAFIVDSASRPAVPEPAATSTSATPTPTPSVLPPPPPQTTPVQVAPPPPPKKRGNGNGNGHKKGGD